MEINIMYFNMWQTLSVTNSIINNLYICKHSHVYIDGFLPHFMQKFNEHHRLVYLLCCCLLKLVPEFTRVCFVFVYFVGFLCFVLFCFVFFIFVLFFILFFILFFLVGERVCAQSLAKCVMNCRKVFVIFLAIALSVPIFTSSNYPLGIFKHSLCPSLEIFL